MPVTSAREHAAVEAAAAVPRSPREPGEPRLVAIVTTALLALAVAAAGTLATAGVAGGDVLEVAGTDRTVSLASYGPQGSTVIGYAHGETVTVRFEIVNRGLVPLTVEAVDPFPVRLGLLRSVAVTVDGAPTPARIGARQRAVVSVTAVFDNCEYVTERAIERYESAHVTWRAAGRSATSAVGYPETVLVRSPTIIDCPGRVLDRSVKQRGREGSITGRG